jgi:iron(III) transport system permease protein
VLPTEAYLQITGMFDLKGGSVLSLLLLVPALCVFLLQRWMVARRSYVTLGGKGARALTGDTVTPGLRWVLVIGCMLVVLLIFYLYGLLAYASAVRAFGANGTLTLDNYRVVFTEGLPAIRDTLIIAGIGMPLGGLYGVLVGSLVEHSRQVSHICLHLVMATPRLQASSSRSGPAR